MLAAERDAAALYKALAAAEEGTRREAFIELAAIEERHAAHWEAKLREAGAEVPRAGRPGLRTRVLGWLSRRVGARPLLPYVERMERADANKYDAEPQAADGMAAEERRHGRRIARMRSTGAGAPAGPTEQIAQRERWHRGDRSGGLRAAVFGVSDGLVSNAALVMGFAGSGAGRSTVLLAGVAGLLAGAFSMAAGEYVSMSSQREMFEREISLEAAELEENPEEERLELALLYEAKGIPKDEAARLADQLMADRPAALDSLVREELGLDPDALGSPWTAAASSMIAFAAGAFVVVLPYLIGGGMPAFVAALAAALVAMFAVGAGIGVINGRSALRSGLRQVVVGALAVAVTYGVGSLIGTTVS
jgi:VIT1/CCC1 family predicted Fe2+/Mn2+ transporter